MSDSVTQPLAVSRLAGTGVRRLTPATTKIFEGAFSLMHCAVLGDPMYRGVFAVLMFPIRYPDRYISMRYTGEKDKVYEIGVIDDLSAFPEATQALVRAVLKKQYTSTSSSGCTKSVTSLACYSSTWKPSAGGRNS